MFSDPSKFGIEINSLGQRTVYSSYSDDGKARLIAVDCGGTMCSGTSYILYKKDKETLALKKIADMVPAEFGGVECPPLYMDIREYNDGYIALGRFSFSSTDSV